LHPHRGQAVRRGAPWDCGFGPLNSRMQYTAAAFAMPIRRIFRPVWRIDEQLERTVDSASGRVTGLRHSLTIGDRAWTLLYEPLGRWVLLAARRVSRMQTGNIRGYLAYSFFTLLFLLWLIS